MWRRRVVRAILQRRLEDTLDAGQRDLAVRRVNVERVDRTEHGEEVGPVARFSR
jgi:hypothetical protein